MLWLQIKDEVVRGLDEKPIKGKKKVDEYIRHRPSDDEIKVFTNECKLYWQSLIDSCVDFGETRGVGKYRSKEGGHIFFRPVSLIPFTKAMVRIKEKENKLYTDIIAAFPQEVFWIQNPIWRKIIWDNDKNGMVMGHQKLVELLLIYIYDENYLSKSEREKIANELISIWDYQGDNIYERLNELMKK